PVMYSRAIRRLAYLAFGSGALTLGSLQAVPWALETYNSRRGYEPPSKRDKTLNQLMDAPLKSREEQLASLANQNGPEFDVLIIGGGATGCGCALDAVSRGLKTALVEKYDFASGTSSRSTKLIHGGVRYLQKAVFNLDYEQYRMVKEALGERANMLHIAPHLTKPLPIMLPIYHLWQLPYYWVGIKMYDLVSGTQILKPSFYLSKSRALEYFPMLNKNALKGALVYYDGQQEDARMCLSLGLTAAKLGASVANYCEVHSLLKSVDPATGKEVLTGARVVDNMTGKEFTVRAKCIVNATGPYTDSVRLMDSPSKPGIVAPSAGVHISLPDYYSPEMMGLLDPATADGRVIFFLPWQNCTIAGTTDTPCTVSDSPHPAEEDVKFILQEIKHYLSPEIVIRRGDVLSAWSGIRPLVTDPNKQDTQSIARNHIIEVSDSRLITIAGGKWTTYRQMSEEAIDTAIEVAGLQPKGPCRTSGLMLLGAYNWSPNLFIRLVQEFGVEPTVAKHLSCLYGDKCLDLIRLEPLSGHRWPVVGKRLHPNYPYLESEVRWACQEYACRAIDILARRTRLAFTNVHAAAEALPRVVAIMAEELGWSDEKCREELKHCKRYLQHEMGYNLKLVERRRHPINLSSEEVADLTKKFRSIDSDNKGFITLSDMERFFKDSDHRLEPHQIREIIDEVDLNRNGRIEISEFLQYMSATKSGFVGSSRFKHVLGDSSAANYKKPQQDARIPVDRSGGGL
ncbi:hypothetical protein BOX15_Mlig010624g3, partial [Macrostomum lignano]